MNNAPNTPDATPGLAEWLDTIRSELLEQAEVLPPVFSADGVPRVVVDLPTLRHLHDTGHAALLALSATMKAIGPQPGTVLVLRMGADIRPPESAVRAAIRSVQSTIDSQGWDPVPPVLAFGPAMDLEQLTPEQRTWLAAGADARVTTLQDRVDLLEEHIGTLLRSLDTGDEQEVREGITVLQGLVESQG